MVVDLFVPCYIDQLYPQTAFNAIKVLKKCGVEVNYNSQQTCCGKIAFESGFRTEAEELGEKFLNEFSGENPIVGLSVSCVAYIQKRYKNLFYNTGNHPRFQAVEKNIFCIEDFLVNKLNVTDFGATFKKTAIYHDSCSSLNLYNKRLYDEPRKLLKNVCELDLLETGKGSCSGSGDLFTVKYSSVSSAMIETEIKAALDCEASTIIVSDSSCMMNLEGYIRKNNLPLAVVHLIDVISSF